MSFREAKSRDDFRVAVICALPLEAEMVTRVFDVKHKDHGKNFGKAKGDRNVYTTGVIGTHNVVLIHMPDIGKIKATAAATEARISFRHIQIAFVVGICGVLPTHPETKEDIVLGDCIISRTIVQYDYGRRHSGNFTTKAALSTLHNPYIPSLLAMLQTAKDRQSLTEELMDFLKEMHDKSSLENLYPGPRRDKLYQTGYRHAHPSGFGRCPQCIPGTDKCFLDCEIMGCSSDRLIKRDRLKSFSGILGSPRIHFGNMGSGDSVMESSSERDRIAHEYSLIAFEMEGAGVWNSFPTVVIKSASDYADSHKNKGWQYFAAATAAAGLKAFLQKWTSTERVMSQAESSRWSMVSTDTDDAISVSSSTPTTTFVDATIMLDHRYQEAYPSLFQRMVGTNWPDPVSSETHRSSSYMTTSATHSRYRSSTRPIEPRNPGVNEVDLVPPIRRSSARLTVPSINLLRLSVDVGSDFSLSMAAVNIETIKPKFEDPSQHQLFFPVDTDMAQTLVEDDDSTSFTTPTLHRHPSNSALRDLFLASELDNEIDNILLDDATLVAEVTQHLIGQARVPEAISNPSKQEVFYPANSLNLTISEMLDAGMTRGAKHLIASLIIAIQEKVFSHDDTLPLCTFWLTNTHQLLSFFSTEKQFYQQEMISDPEYGAFVEISSENMQSLEFNIYFAMTKALKKKLQPMIIPVMIELKDLPSGKAIAGDPSIKASPAHNDKPFVFSMHDLLNVLDDIVETMKAYYLEDSIIRQIITELLRFVGIIAFNDLLQRKNFLSRSRGHQIAYNILRLEEWCQEHGMAESILAFKELLQAVELLQMDKAELEYQGTIWGICCMLSYKQIHHLLSNYVLSKNETSIRQYTEKIAENDSNEKPLLLSISELDQITYETPYPRAITTLSTSPPDWLEIPRLRRLAALISAQVVSEEARKKASRNSMDKSEGD